MKKIVILELLGSNVRSRSNVERIREMIERDDSYVIDMSGVEFISRSAADEMCSISEVFNIEIQNSAGVVDNMLKIVSSNRKKKRIRGEDDSVVKGFESFEALSQFLLTM